MIIRTKKLSDKKLVDVLRDLAKLLPDFRVTGQYFGAVAFEVDSAEALDELEQKANERLIKQFRVTSGQQSDEVRFARGVFNQAKLPNGQPEIHYFDRERIVSEGYDEFAFFENPNAGNIGGYFHFSADLTLDVGRLLNKLAAPLRTVAGADSEALSKLVDQNVDDLQRLSVEFVERMAAARQKEEEAFAERLQRQDDEHEKRLSALDSERAELERLRRELNDREPQHERRRLREQVNKELAAYLAKPWEGNLFQRHAVQFFYMVAGVLFLGISVLLVLRVDSAAEVGSAAFWVQSVKSLASGLGGAAFIWAGLSGLSKSVNRETEHTQALQRFSFDMDRASWVVETLLQMNSLESSQVPDAWLEAVCHDLFANTHSEQRKEPTSLNALAALLDSTARASVGSDGFKFELDKKAARKVAGQAQD